MHLSRSLIFSCNLGLLLLAANYFVQVNSEFFTAALVGWSVAIPFTYKVGEYAYCQFKECDNAEWAIHDPNIFKAKLTKEWKQHVFGQDLALKIIRNMLTSHLVRISKKTSKKALVLSFHGGVGTGKTLVAKLLAKVLYKNGLSSSYVRRIHLKDFLTNLNMDGKKHKLKTEIKRFVQSCTRPLVLFEEVDKLEAGVIDALSPYFDESSVDNVSYANTIFIFTSNYASREINEEACRQFTVTTEVDDFDSENFYDIIRKISYRGTSADDSTSRTGFASSEFVKHCLVSSFVPFLPLDMTHVLQCIDASLTRKLKDHEVSTLDKPERKNDLIKLIYSQIHTVNADRCRKSFSEHGCKKVGDIADREVTHLM
ncbi:uncharacterized protein TRIADDRAFT_33759 [Trichoplax adhaerens]|uniref:AAA+ ATPase domain-containing protein n=1 Tax=Trichoplax adhaerens TaxID=10228 RepID=B3SD48_TRIAD|nr:hypothetical protein TRIADDRAFT_33759 [Trichoplax adhaerens]EDV19337.1 hypothetical protein TRIADDRAFT_33759 [Trichoplax adhaerens]|eukprot:XP_002118188.1 hypothetical protein TRIADDRAFT_33759 [Trichoplax adhaerens]